MANGISQTIVAARKNKADGLQKILNNCSALQSSLDAVTQKLTALGRPRSEKIKKALARLEAFQHRVDVIHKKFEQGLVTIAIAGLEKAGKTTFLRSLTGLEEGILPEAPERCTAVGCEIIYDENREDAEIEFYTQQEYFTRVINPLIIFINDKISKEQEAHPGKELNQIQTVASSSEFASLTIPSPEDVFHKGTEGTEGYDCLQQLNTLHSQHESIARCLGTTGPKLTFKELPSWVRHPEQPDPVKSAQLSCVKRCKIYTKFDGGSESLRWMDTPGVNDPNPRALDITLKVIGDEADLLVLASKPAANPSPTKDFTSFWTALDRLPGEVDLRNKLLVVLNWHKGADPDGNILEKHKNYLVIDHKVPANIIKSPFVATSRVDAQKLMEEANKHLENCLPAQDAETIRVLNSEMQSIKAYIRTEVYDQLQKISPKNIGTDSIIWHKVNDFVEKFIPELRRRFTNYTQVIKTSDMVNNAQKSLEEQLKEIRKQLRESHPDEPAVRSWQEEGESVIERGLAVLSQTHNDAANKLSSTVVAFGPQLQNWLIQILEESGIGGLMQGSTPSERLRALAEAAAESETEESKGKPRLASLFREAADIENNLRYLFRFDLRPAINFTEVQLWTNPQMKADMLNDMESLFTGSGEKVPEKLHKIEILSRTADAGQIVEMFKDIAAFSVVAINLVATGGRCSMKRIAEDFARHCHIQLTRGDEVALEWRNFIGDHAQRIVPGIQKVYDESQSLHEFRDALRQLEAALN